MRKKNIDVLVIALATPIYIGIYENGILIKSVISDEKSSESLPMIFQDLLQSYEIQGLFYANGPGSFMAIKVAYIFLKSLSILKSIQLKAIDAFYFNANKPIKAIGKLYFVKIQGNIVTQKLEEAQEVCFSLPQKLEKEKFTNNASPLYKIGAVG